MHQEILSASSFMTSLLPSSIRPEILDLYTIELVKILTSSYSSHWHASSGSGYRALTIFEDNVDSRIVNAGLAISPQFGRAVLKYFAGKFNGSDFVCWVDPGCVSVRMGGERAPIYVVYDSSLEPTMEFENDLMESAYLSEEEYSVLGLQSPSRSYSSRRYSSASSTASSYSMHSSLVSMPSSGGSYSMGSVTMSNLLATDDASSQQSGNIPPSPPSSPIPIKKSNVSSQVPLTSTSAYLPSPPSTPSFLSNLTTSDVGSIIPSGVHDTASSPVKPSTSGRPIVSSGRPVMAQCVPQAMKVVDSTTSSSKISFFSKKKKTGCKGSNRWTSWKSKGTSSTVGVGA